MNGSGPQKFFRHFETRRFICITVRSRFKFLESKLLHTCTLFQTLNVPAVAQVYLHPSLVFEGPVSPQDVCCGLLEASFLSAVY